MGSSGGQHRGLCPTSLANYCRYVEMVCFVLLFEDYWLSASAFGRPQHSPGLAVDRRMSCTVYRSIGECLVKLTAQVGDGEPSACRRAALGRHPSYGSAFASQTQIALLKGVLLLFARPHLDHNQQRR